MLRDVKIDDICWQLPAPWGGGFRELENSPHFKALNGDDAEYFKYVAACFSGEDGFKKLKDFKVLAINFEYLKGDYEYGRTGSLESSKSQDFPYYIIIKKNQGYGSWGGRYYATDGDHRLAIMKHRGDKTVSCNDRTD